MPLLQNKEKGKAGQRTSKPVCVRYPPCARQRRLPSPDVYESAMMLKVSFPFGIERSLERDHRAMCSVELLADLIVSHGDFSFSSPGFAQVFLSARHSRVIPSTASPGFLRSYLDGKLPRSL